MNPNYKKNLIPFNKMSPEQAAAIRSKGGKARGKQKVEEASMRKAIKNIMQMPLTDLITESSRKIAENNGIYIDTTLTASEQFVLSVFCKGIILGDARALQVLANLIGDTAKHDIEVQQLKNDIERVQIEKDRLEALKQQTVDENNVLTMWTEAILHSEPN